MLFAGAVWRRQIYEQGHAHVGRSASAHARAQIGSGVGGRVARGGEEAHVDLGATALGELRDRNSPSCN